MRLLVVDDHEVLRRGVRSLLEDQPGYEICGEAADGQEAVGKARELRPDVIVMDISMPRLSGLEAASLIRSSLPDCEIVLLTQHDAPEMARQALKAGARGYVVKSSMARDLISAVERVAQHKYFYDPSFADLTGRTANMDVQEILNRSAVLEQALRESEQLYRSTFEIAAVGISHVAPDGHWLRVNRKLCEIVGYTEEELLKLTFQEMTHPDDLAADLVLTEKILTGELDTFSMGKRYIRKDGSPVWVMLTVAAVRHPDRRLKHFVSVVEDISARKEFEDTLQDREGRFRLAEAAAQVGSWEWDPVSGARKLSPELRRILAVDDSDEGVQKWAARVHADDRRALEMRMEESNRTGEMDFEYRYHHPDLGLRWLHSKGRRLGNESRLFGVVLDVTERKQAQAALQQSEEHLRAIVETTPECVQLVDSQGVILHMNAAGLKMFGASSTETVVGRNIYDFVVPEDRESFREFNRKICDGEKATLEFDILGFQGVRRSMESHAAPLRQPDGRRIQLAVMRDITGRMLASRASGLLAAIVDSSDDAVISKSLDGVITSWNKGAERIFGYTAAEAIGQHITLIIPEDRRQEEVGILRRLRNGERIDHFETVRKCKDGTLLDISVTISPVRDDRGRIVGASKVARDISDRKRADAALRRSEEQLRQLSATLDAEVRARTSELEARNAEVLRQSDLLRELSWHVARAQEDERRHIARELHDSAGQTLTVLGLSAAELVSEAAGVAPELAKLGEGLQQLIQQLHREIRTASYLLHPPLLDEAGISSALGWYVQGLIERSGMSITLDISSDIGRLPGDMELVIFRLVQECLTNVHRHSESRTAAIRISSEGDEVRVEVTDRGIGIPPERLAKLQAGGSGIGIRGMQERLRQFRGSMKIESSGSGTTVIATIPVPKRAGSGFDVEPSHTAV
jgi:PAS domain S-box-containing protein